MFIFCVEDVKNAQIENLIQEYYWKKSGDKFILSLAQHEINPYDKELMNKNFTCLGQAAFESRLSDCDWEKPLELLARKFNENEIEWYIIGSVCDAIRGVAVKPGDMDIVVHTRDFAKVKEICYTCVSDSVIFPFLDNQKLCPLRCYGRLFLSGAWIEIAADENWNIENRQSKYEKIVWRGHDIYVESLQHRYQVEIARNRMDRIKAIEKYMNRTE